MKSSPNLVVSVCVIAKLVLRHTVIVCCVYCMTCVSRWEIHHLSLLVGSLQQQSINQSTHGKLTTCRVAVSISQVSYMLVTMFLYNRVIIHSNVQLFPHIGVELHRLPCRSLSIFAQHDLISWNRQCLTFDIASGRSHSTIDWFTLKVKCLCFTTAQRVVGDYLQTSWCVLFKLRQSIW